ncbi:MAG: glycoside hydrolase 43 family protein [Vallitaleaceae bacterium]|nr:glycoside hydrolase 43 family protein [Vallitaleaceae bacterium]
MKTNWLWKSDLENGLFQNPILFADYSDPDVIRVGDVYYMTASSFNYTPGLPILISKDLVNWELVNYAINNIAYEQYQKPAHAKGIWAPAIRYYNHTFWITYGMPDEGIFIISSQDPLGEWSEPVLLLEGKGYIDPCPFWDEDGRAYIIHGYAKSRIGFKSILGIFEINVEATKAIGDDHFIYDGTLSQITIEGPKVYKREGYYYIFAPAGGVKTGWQTVLRSKNIEGPYEEKIVMEQKDTMINGPHQGGLVDTVHGEEWFIHFQDRGFYGRIVHLQPVRWENQWPIIGVDADEEGCGKPCIIHKKPQGLLAEKISYLEADDEFERKSLSLQWQWLGNHLPSFYSLEENSGHLRLFALNLVKEENPYIWNASNVLTQKIVCPSFTAEIQMDFSGLKEGEKAGCVVLGGQYASLAVRKENYVHRLVYLESYDVNQQKSEKLQELAVLPEESKTIIFQIRLLDENGMKIRMAYSLDEKNFIDCGVCFEPSDHTWVGSKIGLYSLASHQEENTGYADFDYIHLKAIGEDGEEA